MYTHFLLSFHMEATLVNYKKPLLVGLPELPRFTTPLLSSYSALVFLIKIGDSCPLTGWLDGGLDSWLPQHLELKSGSVARLLSPHLGEGRHHVCLLG